MHIGVCTLPLSAEKLGWPSSRWSVQGQLPLSALHSMQRYHSSLPVFQTQHIGIVLKVSVDNPRYKKQPASGWPWTLLSALHIGQGWLVASNSGWIPLNKVSRSHWMYFHTSSSASPSKFSGIGVFHVAPVACHQQFYIDAGVTSLKRTTTDHTKAFSFEHWHCIAVQSIRHAVESKHWPQAEKP